jgi:hypothetical protein
VTRNYSVAPLPPEAAEGYCRWCGKKLLHYMTDGAPFCEGGCAANDNPLYLEQCDLCGRDYETGRRWSRTCYECETREMAQVRAEGGVRQPGYQTDVTRRGANREAIKIRDALDSQE